ncbi:hypothetical protein IEE_04284 [Bacillus cereus BAG5X1-1]|uniref:Uncharacterized protein n=2 Tax=Bacillaceae TaxID=186817 RepID=J8A0L1_BACCE|nr:hypothetical protein [Bacillus cereus]EJQ42121.1 hypothetical protein IEE_04284 [Bacillus cereus BAG5X1-1]EJV59204.1 hypothetical protein IEM_04387 [Bacillus cereus BAG6O-2]WJE26988.1 hypothetical protein QRE65_08905 [Bacillus cereus]
MKQKILAMSLPILLLTGVGCSNSEKENKPASAEQQEKKSFILTLAHSSEDLESIMKDLKNLYKQDSTLKSVKESYIISLDKMKDILSKIYELDVDQKFKEHEEELAEAIRAYYQSIQYQKEVAQKDSEPNALDGKIKLEQSEDKFIEVVNKMIDIENGEAPEKKLEVKETNKPKLEDLPIEPAKPAYTENYMGKFGVAMKQLLPELQKLIAVGGNENLPSSDRAMKIIENEATLKGIANELRSYNPSEEYNEVQAKVEEVPPKIDKFIDLLTEGLLSEDPAKVRQASETFDFIIKTMNQAAEMLLEVDKNKQK